MRRLCLAFVTIPVAGSAMAADVTARQVTEALHAARASEPLNYSGQDLSFLDLAGLDFKKAKLARTNLYGADLSKANLGGSDLSGARLDRASLAQADLSGANLKGATLLTITAHTTTEPNLADAPNFSGADLSQATIAARLDGADFRNADLSGAHLGQMIATWGSYRPRAILNGAKFSNAKMAGADLSKAVLQFTDFTAADLRGANVRDCDFTKANLTGADLTGADVTNADFDGATLTGVKGLDTTAGLSEAKNLDKAIR